jgi:hypothetical protein
LLLLVPSIVGVRTDPARAHIHLVFGAIWLGCVLAAGLGNYPTPVVGYGGSAILGYMLSLSAFRDTAQSEAKLAAERAEHATEELPPLQSRALTT